LTDIQVKPKRAGAAGLVQVGGRRVIAAADTSWMLPLL